jgi:hypothetical protein
MLMDVIPLDATLVKGSHGVTPENPLDWPILIHSVNQPTPVQASEIYSILKEGITSP